MSPAARGVLSSPVMWVVGAAGFLARGGILVLALPILSLPTPVGVTLLVPPLSVTTSGISSVFLPELLAAGAVTLLVVALGLLVGALADAVVYRQLVDLARAHATAALDTAAHATAAPGSILPAAMPGPRGGAPRLVAKLIGVEVLALLPAIAMSIFTVSRLIAVGEQEYLLPSSTSVPYVARVLNGASTALVALGACLLLADVVNALVSRRLLRGAYRPAKVPMGGRPRPAARAEQALRGAARMAATWLAAWLVTIVSLVPGLLAIALAWPAVRDTYAATLSSAPPGPVELVAATLAFVAAWIVALLVAGAGSALRAAAWSSGRLP
jgi:hypothetical protein